MNAKMVAGYFKPDAVPHDAERGVAKCRRLDIGWNLCVLLIT